MHGSSVYVGGGLLGWGSGVSWLSRCGSIGGCWHKRWAAAERVRAIQARHRDTGWTVAHGL